MSSTTSAVQTKEKLYAQLAASLGRMSRAVSQTADLCEMLQVDLHAMRTFAGLDAAKYARCPANTAFLATNLLIPYVFCVSLDS